MSDMSPDITAPALGTVVSTSLCTDGYVGHFTPDHVRGLSWQSRGTLAFDHIMGEKWPQYDVQAERLLAIGGHQIIAESGAKLPAGIEAIVIKWGEDFDTVEANAHTLIHAIGASEARLEGWIERRRALQDMTSQLREEARPRILYVSRNGASAGPGTFVDAVITLAGGQNIMTTPGWFTPKTEDLLSLKPDLIITSFFDTDYHSISDRVVTHAAVQRWMNRHAQLDIEGRLWPCAGPGLLDAAEQISTKIVGLSQ